MSQRKPRKRDYIPPEHEVVNKRERSPRKREAARARARGNSGGGAGITRRDGKEFTMPEPTFRRTLRRVPLYLLMIFALYYFTFSKDGKLEGRALVTQAVFTAAIVTVAFTPMMYLMERWQYARYLRKGGRVLSKSNKADDAG
jgi:hypothetical protein